MEITIRELTSSDTDIFKKLIIKGLKEDAECFRITPEDEGSEPFPTCNQEDSFTLGAFSGNQLVGTASFKRDGHNRVKLQHKGILFKIFVHADHRQKGIAKTLIAQVIDRVRQVKDIEQVNLTVIPTNRHAKKLYENFGFTTFASEEKAIKWEGQYFKEDQMKLML